MIKVLIIATLLTSSIANAKMAETIWSKSYAFEAQGRYFEAESGLDLMLGDKVKVKARELALLRLGWLKYLQKDYSASISYYITAMKLNPQSLQAKIGILLPLQAQERWHECELYAKKAIDDDSWNYDAHINLMYCQQGLFKWNQIEKQASTVVIRYPASVMPYLYLARAQHQLNKKNEAAESYMSVLRLSPDNFEATAYVEKFL